MFDSHQAVLLAEAVAALLTDKDGVYVDGTFGRGGHTGRILELLSSRGRLIAFDKDPAAAVVARGVASNDPRLSFYQKSFAELHNAIPAPVTGVLLDLGVSSPQLDDASRGFSFLADGPLDMRMNTDTGPTAAEWLDHVGEAELADVLKTYGEERFARRIAAAIIARRPFRRTSDLARVVSEANPRWEKHKHPATRSFQAIRIVVNRELEDLELFLAGTRDNLAIGGRLVVISFHSLEDRIVKRFMRDGSRGKPIPRGVPIADVDSGRTLRLIGRAIRPTEAEMAANPRARSAIMRVAERVA